VDHRSVAQHREVEAVTVERDELRPQLRDLAAEGADELFLRPLAHVGCADGVHRPVVSLPVSDEGSDADDRVVDVLRKLVADRLADFHVGLADEVVGGRAICGLVNLILVIGFIGQSSGSALVAVSRFLVA